MLNLIERERLLCMQKSTDTLFFHKIYYIFSLISLTSSFLSQNICFHLHYALFNICKALSLCDLDLKSTLYGSIHKNDFPVEKPSK